ncbi:MAG: lysostaphin resistance A-like protein [Phenylobacterium sp.]|uniref:CPBP family intramembrane glutamic endopeptidase n=1 Tax=Phenylobacterium sp. TaxID=1871053 RepID=UPI00391AC7AD
MTTFLDYAARGANAWWRYALGLALTFVFAIGLGAVVTAGLMAARALPDDIAERMLDPGRPIAFFLATGVMFGVVAVALLAAVRLAHGKRFGDLVGAWSWRAWLRGAGIWAVVLVLAALLDFAIAPSGFSVSADARTPMLVAVALPALMVQTFAEELLFRGYLTQGLLLATRRLAPTALVSGLIFGAVHIPNGAPHAASATVFGVVLAVIAIRTGGVAFTSGLHLANNLFAAVVLVSSGDTFASTPGLFTQATPHLMWWDAAVGAVGLVVVAVFFSGPRASSGR